MISAMRSKVSASLGKSRESQSPESKLVANAIIIQTSSPATTPGAMLKSAKSVGSNASQSHVTDGKSEVPAPKNRSNDSSAEALSHAPPLMRVQSHQQPTTATTVSPQYYTVVVHSSTHSSDDAIFPPDLVRDWYLSHSDVPNFVAQDMHYIELLSEALVNDNDKIQQRDRLVLRVPALDSVATTADPSSHDSRAVRLEISISATLAEMFGLVPFGRVLVRSAAASNVEINFMELVFRKQFLQRGNIWRFKKSMLGRSVFVGQTMNVDGVQATVQELAVKGVAARSGIVTDNSQMIFRCRSTRIIWLVQISSEMWEYDQAGDLYYEKFLNKFVGPLLDRWQALSTSHSLSVVFFARTLYIDEQMAATHASNGAGTGWHAEEEPGNSSNIHRRSSDGVFYQDFFKVVIENVAELVKTKIVQTLKEEFWDFPRLLKWNLGKAAPSDAASGNMLEAINTTLNVLDKHHMDRDLLRTGNSIVMVSASTAFFKVNPWMAQISKQRMMDNGIGLDFVSLSQPPMHVVPLFLIDCSSMLDTQASKYVGFNAGAHAASALARSGDDVNCRASGEFSDKGAATSAPADNDIPSHPKRGHVSEINPPRVQDFYEVPHWVSVTYVDCQDQNAFYFLPPTASQQVPPKGSSSGHIIGSGNSMISQGAPRGYSDTARKFDFIKNDGPKGEFGLDHMDKAAQSKSGPLAALGGKAFQANEINAKGRNKEPDVPGDAAKQTYTDSNKGVRFSLNARAEASVNTGAGSEKATIIASQNDSNAYGTSETFILPPFASQINGFLGMNKRKHAQGVHPRKARQLSYTSVLVDTGLPSTLRALLKANERKSRRDEANLPSTAKGVTQASPQGQPGNASARYDQAGTSRAMSGSAVRADLESPGGVQSELDEAMPLRRRQWGHLQFDTASRDASMLASTLANELAAGATAKLVEQHSLDRIESQKALALGHDLDTRRDLTDDVEADALRREVCRRVLDALVVCVSDQGAYQPSNYKQELSASSEFLHDDAGPSKRRALYALLRKHYRQRIETAAKLGSFRRRLQDLHSNSYVSASKPPLWNAPELPFLPHVALRAAGRRNGVQNNKLKKAAVGGFSVAGVSSFAPKGIPSRARAGSHDVLASGSLDTFSVISGHEMPLSGLRGRRPTSGRRHADSIDIPPRSKSPSNAEPNSAEFSFDLVRNSRGEYLEGSGSFNRSGRSASNAGSFGIPSLQNNSHDASDFIFRRNSVSGFICGATLQEFVDAYDSGTFSGSTLMPVAPIIGMESRRTIGASTKYRSEKDVARRPRENSNSDRGSESHLSTGRERDRTLSFSTPLAIVEYDDGCEEEEAAVVAGSKDASYPTYARKLSVSFDANKRPHGNGSIQVSNPGLYSPRRSNQDIAGSIRYPTSMDAASFTAGDGESSYSHMPDALSKVLQLLVSYRTKDAVNPFRRTESVLIARTINRRRWSHLYPKAWQEKSKKGNGNSGASNSNTSATTASSRQALVNHIGYAYYGLNWKSLCQPAILPITTDFVPSVSDLENSYNIQSTYSLILDARECPFATPEALLTEMVCQRLSQEFQLVEGDDFDPKPYKEYVGSTDDKEVNKPASGEKNAGGSERNLITNRANIGGVLFYVLSMGHRVQFLLYDSSDRRIKVVQLVSHKVEMEGRDPSRDQALYSFHLGRNTNAVTKVSNGANADLEMEDIRMNDTGDSSNVAIATASALVAASANAYAMKNGDSKLTKYSTALYDYSIWVPQTMRFQVLTQQFWKFPSEFFWNKVDGILIGTGRFDIQGSDGHRYGDEIRAKRLRFAVLPDIVTTDKELAEYFAKIERLVQFFREKLFKGERIDVKFDASLKPSSGPQASQSTYESAQDEDSKGNISNRAPAPTTIGNVVIHARAPRAVVSRKDYTVPIWLKPPISGEYAAANGYEDTKDKDYKSSTYCPEWAFLKYDATVSAHRVFLIELHWLVCDSWNMDKFVNLLFRRCSAWGIKLAQIPEFFISANLQLHPFRAQPYLAVPFTSSMPRFVRIQRLREDGSSYFCDEKPAYPTAVELVERLYLKVRGKAWIEDEARRTNWGELGLPTPDYGNNSVPTEVDSYAEHIPHSRTLVAEERNVAQPIAGLIRPAKDVPTAASAHIKESDRSIGSLLSAPLNYLAETLSSGSAATDASVQASPGASQKLTPLRPAYAVTSATAQHNSHALASARKGSFAPLTRGASFHGAATPGDAMRGGGGRASSGSLIASASAILPGRTNLDRQYMHRQGIACVRVAAHGFVWLLNSGVRMAVSGKAEKAEKDAVPSRSDPKQPPAHAHLHAAQMHHAPVASAHTAHSVAAVAITAKDGTIINIKERGSNNAASALAAMAAAEVAEKAQSLLSKTDVIVAQEGLSGIAAALAKADERAVVAASVPRADNSHDVKREDVEEFDAQTPEGRRQLALSVLQHFGRFCVAVGNSYDILVSVIESAMDEATRRAEQAANPDDDSDGSVAHSVQSTGESPLDSPLSFEIGFSRNFEKNAAHASEQYER